MFQLNIINRDNEKAIFVLKKVPIGTRQSKKKHDE